MAQASLGDILVGSGQLSAAQLERALAEQRSLGGDLGKHLLRLGVISEDTLVRALSAQLGVPAVALDRHPFDARVAYQLPQQFCTRNRVVCFAMDERADVIDIAMAYPNEALAAEARVLSGYEVRAYLAPPGQIDRAIAQMVRSEDPTTLDLSPDSPLRVGPRVDRLREPAKPPSTSAKGTAAPLTSSAVQPLHVAPRSPRRSHTPIPPLQAAPAKGQRGSASAAARTHRGAGGESLFHITLDVPVIQTDEQEASVEQRLERVEQTLARHGQLIEWLFSALVERGTLRQQDLDSLT